MHRRALWFGLGLLVALAACTSNRYAYAPVKPTSAVADVDGRPAAVIAVPPEAPRGELRLASLGVARVIPPTESHVLEFRGLYLRLLVANQSDEVWTVDEAEQRIELQEHGQTVTNQATTPTTARPPVVQIAPGKSFSLDLLFGLPLGSRDAGELPGFEVIWTVHVGARAVTGRVAFQRRLESAAAATSPPFYEPLPPPYQIPERYSPPDR